ncbi:hypothetical protein E2542_SST10381 [Spatholobus suberectus]|nr:hypothetical protein E2542_SST10381 [Spatholobus suberectus]
MSYLKARTLLNLIAVVMCVAILISQSKVEASRVLWHSEEFAFARANNLQTYTSSAYEQAKNTMVFWMQRLSSGPSPKGPGH